MSTPSLYAAHKHVSSPTGAERCVQVQIKDGVQTAWVDGGILHELLVAHGPIALRFSKKTLDDNYPGGVWLDGLCPACSPPTSP